ncbi:hypothetical protein ACFE04_018279 [Oxalis oulophora]
MAEGISHGRVGVDFELMELVCENGEIVERRICRRGRVSPSSMPESRTSSKKNTRNSTILLFPDDKFYQCQDLQIVPVQENEFIFLEESAASVPIIRSRKINPDHSLEGLREFKNQVQESEQNKKKRISVPTPNDVSKQVNTNIPNEIKDGNYVPTLGNNEHYSQAVDFGDPLLNLRILNENQYSSTCSLGASNDVTCTFRGGYEGSDERSDCQSFINTLESRKRATKRCQFPEDHALLERRKRGKINKRMSKLQKLIPNCNKVDKASMLDEAIDYLKMLQFQVDQMMSLGNGVCLSPMNMMQQIYYHQVSRMMILQGCNSSPFLNFPLPGIASPTMPGITDSRVTPMRPVSFSQLPIIPNFLQGHFCSNPIPAAHAPAAGLLFHGHAYK